MPRINSKVKDALDTKVQYIRYDTLMYIDIKDIIKFLTNDVLENTDYIDMLNDILLKGFIGYENFTIKELVTLFQCRKNSSGGSITNLRVQSGKRWVKII